MSDLSQVNFEAMTPATFEEILPDLFQSGEKVSSDSRLSAFFTRNPDALGLVRDLEAIAETARSLFDEDPVEEPSDTVWSNIAAKMQSGADPEEGGGTPQLVT